MGKPKYFHGAKIIYEKHGLLLSQRKYTLEMLEKIDLLGCKHVSTPMEVNIDLWCVGSHFLDDTGQYRRLIGNLIYITITRT